MDTQDDWPSLNGLTEALWVQRRHGERLLYALTAANLLLREQRDELLPHAVGDIRDAAQRLRRTDTLVEAARHEADRDLQLAGTELGDTVARAPEPWATILAEHQQARTALARSILEMLSSNRALAAAALLRVRSRLLALDDGEPAASLLRPRQ